MTERVSRAIADQCLFQKQVQTFEPSQVLEWPLYIAVGILMRLLSSIHSSK